MKVKAAENICADRTLKQNHALFRHIVHTSFRLARKVRQKFLAETCAPSNPAIPLRERANLSVQLSIRDNGKVCMQSLRPEGRSWRCKSALSACASSVDLWACVCPGCMYGYAYVLFMREREPSSHRGTLLQSKTPLSASLIRHSDTNTYIQRDTELCPAHACLMQK
jgi:hypothetical protein